MAKITEPLNGIVSFILNNRRKFGRASDRGCEADIWFMDYSFPIYVVGIKPERKCVGFRLLLGVLFGDCPNVVKL